FLSLPERQRTGLLELAASTRARVEEWQAMAVRFEHLWPRVSGAERRDGELAVVLAWVTDRGSVRTLLDAERWQREELPRLLGAPQPGTWYGDLWRSMQAWLEPLPADRWLEVHQPERRVYWRER